MEKWLETSIFEHLPTRIGREFVSKKNMVHTAHAKNISYGVVQPKDKNKQI